jgi:thioredoxin 1
MPYFSTGLDGLGEFGCGADCSCKSCRSASNVGEVYEKEESAPPAPAKPPAAPKMGGWFGEPPLTRPRVSVMRGQLQIPPFEVLTGYAPGQWRLNQAQLSRIQRLAQHIVRAWTTASPVTGVRLIGFAEPPEAQAGLQRAVAARAALTDSINRLNSGVLRGINFSAEDGGPAATSGGVPRVEILLRVGLGTRAFGFRLPANAPEGQKRFPISKRRTSMYIQTSEGLGQNVILGNGDERIKWSLGEFQPMPTAAGIYADPANRLLVRELTDANFWNIFSDRNKVLVVDFWATWCPPCNDVANVMVKVAKRCYRGPHGRVKFYQVQWDSNVNPKVSTQFGFDAIPVVYFYYTATGRPPSRSAPLLEGSLAGESSFRPLHRIFDPEEYVSRIRAILRRHGHPAIC